MTLSVKPYPPLFYLAILGLLFATPCSYAQNEDDSTNLDFGTNNSRWADDGECDDPRFVGQGMAFAPQDEDVRQDANDCRLLHSLGMIRLWDAHAIVGQLESGDLNIGTEKHEDSFTFDISSEAVISIDLRSHDFDTVLILQDQSGSVVGENDDYNGDTSRSYLELSLLPQLYEIVVTSFKSLEIGEYSLVVQQTTYVELDERKLSNGN